MIKIEKKIKEFRKVNARVMLKNVIKSCFIRDLEVKALNGINLNIEKGGIKINLKNFVL